MEYFTHEKITPNITRIRDICGVFVYLVEGNEKACLIDTGDGFGDLKSYVEKLCDKEYYVVLTHGHVDHANGAALFDEVYMNAKDEAIYRLHSSFEFRQEEAKQNLLTKDIPLSDYNPIREKPFLSLTDKQVFDLGGIHVQAVATPGHTPGMTMMFIPEERIMLFGDGCGNKVLLFDDYSSCVSEYLATLEYVKTYEDGYDRIIRNHTNGESNKILLDNVIECCKNILAGKDAHEETEFAGMKLYSAKALNEEQFPIDNSEGNILYRIDKMK